MELTNSLVTSVVFPEPLVHLGKKLSEATHFQITLLAAPKIMQTHSTHKTIRESAFFCL